MLNPNHTRRGIPHASLTPFVIDEVQILDYRRPLDLHRPPLGSIDSLPPPDYYEHLTLSFTAEVSGKVRKDPKVIPDSCNRSTRHNPYAPKSDGSDNGSLAFTRVKTEQIHAYIVISS
jgi:hypothetical protein